MPVHRVLVSEVEDRLTEVEKHERIISVVPQGDESVLIFTEAKRQKPGPKETR